MIKERRQVCSHTDYLEKYFTNIGCGMYTRKYEIFICPHKFSSGDNYFVYDNDDNYVFGLIYITTESADTPDSEILGEDVVDTMGDDIIEAM